MLDSVAGSTPGDRHKIERDSLAWAVFGFAMLVLIGLIAGWSLRQMNVADAAVYHTYDLINASQQLTAQVDDAKIAEREYAISGDEKYIGRYREAAAGALQSFARIRDLTSDSASQQKRLNELGPLLTSEFNNLAGMIDLRNKNDESATGSLVSRENAVTERIHDLGQEIEQEEYQLLRQRADVRRNQLHRGMAGTIGAALFALLALVLATVQVRRAIKERDAADRQKKESESIAQSLFNAAPEAIVIVDRSGSIVMANPETEKLFGYEVKELRGQPLGMLLPKRLRELHGHRQAEYFAEPRTRPMGLNLNIRGLRKNGTEFDAEVSLGYFETEKGLLAVAFLSDISKRKADERAIQQQGQELRQLAGKLITAQDDERRRIARNLHDDLTQSLAAIGIDAGRLASKYSAQEVGRDLRRLQERATDAAEQVRQISHQLHPSILDDLGLKVALEEYCSEFESRSGIVTHFTSENMPNYLPYDVSDCIYHIAGECLRNVSKHSKSGSVCVKIGMTGNLLRMDVKDKGIGFRQSASGAGDGIGIVTMKERARLLGGTVSIHADIAQGTTVSIEVPVDVT